MFINSVYQLFVLPISLITIRIQVQFTLLCLEVFLTVNCKTLNESEANG